MAASRIVLIGYRGSGKTSIGRVLAEQLWKTYVDVDYVTRERFDNKTIAEIWEEFGDPAWRHARIMVSTADTYEPRLCRTTSTGVFV